LDPPVKFPDALKLEIDDVFKLSKVNILARICPELIAMVLIDGPTKLPVAFILDILAIWLTFNPDVVTAEANTLQKLAPAPFNAPKLVSKLSAETLSV
jgi:hypothetical protein